MVSLKPKQLSSLLVFSLLGSILNFGILYSISMAISDKNAIGFKYALFFFSLLTYSWLLNLMFQKKIIRLSNELIYENEIRVFKKVLNSRLIDFEKIGKERLYGTLEDLRSLVFIPFVITIGLNSSITILVGTVYLFIISSKAAIFFIASALILVFIYLFINRIVVRWSQQSRELNDYYFQIIRDVIDGFKELKLNSSLRLNLTNNFLVKNRISAKELEIKISNSFLITNLMGNFSFLAIVGLIAFVLPAFDILDQDLIGSFVVILLLISGALNTLFSLQNFYTRIFVANKRIELFIRDLDTNKHEHLNPTVTEDKFGEIVFDNVSFNYPDSKFSISSVNLKIEKGETIFIIGGNGSGKSTFINLLTNLYNPSKGTIFFNKTPIGMANQGYRDMLSVIYTNNYLFSENYNNYSFKDNPELQDLIHQMQLDEIISKNEDITKKQFSKGQSKRISMILALLEKRPIVVLDEWAADQDPYFRKYFYETIMPKLKKEGKTIIAVTHDDNYFSYADRIIKFDYGTIVKDIKVDREFTNKELIWNH